MKHALSFELKLPTPQKLDGAGEMLPFTTPLAAPHAPSSFENRGPDKDPPSLKVIWPAELLNRQTPEYASSSAMFAGVTVQSTGSPTVTALWMRSCSVCTPLVNFQWIDMTTVAPSDVMTCCHSSCGSVYAVEER